MSNWKLYVSSLRLRTLTLSLSGIVLGSCWGQRFGGMEWLTFILALACATCLQILSNLANELGDFRKGSDADDRVGPQRALQSGLISERRMMRMIAGFASASLLTGVGMLFSAFGSWSSPDFLLFSLIGLAAVAAAVCYTMGPKPYGYIGLGDLFVFLFFGLASTAGGYYLQHQALPPEAWILSCVPGCLSIAVLNCNNMRDIDTDRKHGKRTLAVLLGLRLSKVYQIIMIAAAVACATVIDWRAVAYTPVAIYHIHYIYTHDNSTFDKQMPVLTISTMMYALYLVGIGMRP